MGPFSPWLKTKCLAIRKRLHTSFLPWIVPSANSNFLFILIISSTQCLGTTTAIFGGLLRTGVIYAQELRANLSWHLVDEWRMEKKERRMAWWLGMDGGMEGVFIILSSCLM